MKLLVYMNTVFIFTLNQSRNLVFQKKKPLTQSFVLFTCLKIFVSKLSQGQTLGSMRFTFTS